MPTRKPVSFIFCSAGQGTRLQEFGPTKALIKLNGLSLLEWSLQSFDFQDKDQLILISQKQAHIAQAFERIRFKSNQIRKDLLEISFNTQGQAHTASLAEHLVCHESIVLFNTDTAFKCSKLDQAIAMESIDGIIPCFPAPGNSWSFVETMEAVGAPWPKAIRVTEKVRISDHCSVGLYYFKNANQFFQMTKNALSNGDSNELYIAPLYNELISQKKNIVILPCEDFKPLGTVEQIFNSLALTPEQIHAENF
jgi:dTDP-glucose pyrophosphorylase